MFCKKHNQRIELVDAETIRKDITILQALGYIKEDLSLTEKGEEVLIGAEEVFRKTKVKAGSHNLGQNYLEEIRIYREKFPTGKKATPQEVLEKFSKLFQQNPEITWAEVHSATDLYFSEPKDDDKYIMKAGNFIMVQRGGNMVYTLQEYIERVREGDKPSTGNVQMYGVVA